MTNWLYRFLREPRGKRAARRRAANSQAGLGRVRPLRIESLEMRRMLSAQPLLVTSPSATAVTLGTTNTTLTDSAVLSGGSSPTGSIVFALMAPDGSTTVDTETVTVNGNGAYTTPTGYTLPTTGTVIGTYQWNVSYGGDINNNSASDNNDPAEQVTVSPAQPTLVTTPNPTSAMLPTALTDSAVLSGGSSPTGSITFTLEAPGGAVVETETVSLNGNGTYSTPGAAGAGVNLVQNGGFETATFSGWTTTAASLGSDFDVGTAGPPHSGYYDVALGALSYIPDSISQTLATVPGDTYTLSYWVSHDSTNAENDFQVFWGGNSVQNLSNVSAFGWTNYTFTETAASATTVLKFSAYEVPAWFFLDDVSVSVHGYTPTQVGTYQWNASYSGDANNNPASDNNDPAEQVTVSPAQPTLVGTPHPTAVTPGPTAITLTDSAVLSGGSSPTGSITFTLVAPGGSTLDIETVTVGGNGTYTTPTGYTLPLRPMPGTYQWDVSYNGDINNNSASDNNDTAEQVTVAAPIAPTFTADSPPVATVGSPYSYQFQASGTQPITYSATGLPAWAQLNSSTGVLSGTPTAPGTSNISVTATNGIAPDATVNVSLVAQVAPLISTFVSSGLDNPWGLAFDAAGNLYVANFYGNTISKVTRAGAVSTFVSSGLDYPTGLALDAAGNLYVANEGNSTISKVTPAGAVSTFVSSGLDYPYGLAFDASGNLYVANYYNSTISKVTPAGAISAFVSSGLSGPLALAFDSAGNLYVANYSNSTISEVTPAGSVSTFASSGLYDPYGLAFDAAGSLYVVTYSRNSISKVTPAGAVSTFVSSGGLDEPVGLAYDTGSLYVANFGNNTISKVTTTALNVTNAATFENTQTTSGLVITPNAADVGTVTSFQITNITGGSLFLNDGVTPVTNGEFITVAQGAAGLKFTPTTGSLASGSFTAEESTTGDASGLIAASTATATITLIPPIVFTADSPPAAAAGSPYSYQFQASGTQPITYSATGLPAWAQLNSSTGVLSGTPTAPGTSNISVTATNGIVPDATVNVSLVAQYEPPTFTADTPPVAVNGSPYSYQFQASGIGPDPLTYSARNPPGWAQLDPSTGILSGTPTVDGTFDFSVTASNGVAPSTTVNVSLIVAETANNFNVAAGTSSTIPGGTYSGGSTFNVGAGATVTIDSGTFTGGAVFNLGAGAVVNIIDPGYSIDSTDPYRLCCENAIRNQN